MIVDVLQNADLYSTVHPLLPKAFEFMRRTDLASLPDGRHPIMGDKVFAVIGNAQTKPPDQGKWEAHHKFWDVQFLIRGRERMGYARMEGTTVTIPYDPETDLVFFNTTGDYFTVQPGMFAIFTLQDVHMPGVAVDKPEHVRKVVVKVAV
jgi:biofilm protein TabA